MSTRVLLVDDHRMLCEGLRLLLLAAKDFDVVGEAGDVASALAMVKKLKPELVVMDVYLPDGSGIDACQQISGLSPQTKVLMLSGHPDMSITKSVMKAGARGFILKDQAADELVRAARAVMAGQMFLCPAAATALVDSYINKPASARLSEREMQVLKAIVDGLRNKEIAAQLNISIKSVETYRARLMSKLGCESTAHLVRFALREGIASL